MLTKENHIKLTSKGLTILEFPNRCYFMKKVGVPGNAIPNLKSIPAATANGELDDELKSDAPILTLWLINGEYELSCWEWVPGPGPGDFRKLFTNQDELVGFVASYFFGENVFFEEKRRYYITVNTI